MNNSLFICKKMLLKVCFLIIIGGVTTNNIIAQNIITGKISNKKGEPLFAVNVYTKSHLELGTTSDFEGNFKLKNVNIKDTLVVSFIGYKTEYIYLQQTNINEPIMVLLKEKSQSIGQVNIKARNPISEKFSIVKMNSLDIYLNPVSQGDPLKAINILPASTTTDESANSSLRASSPVRSRVTINNVPINNPTKGNDLNNTGHFSLFSTEIVDNQFVYASNPPLTTGNTSAGLVNIQTIKELKSNSLSLSASLASIGFFLSQKLKKDVSFIQVYGNYQFSDAFTATQKKYLPYIKYFDTQDFGINFNTKLGKNTEFNSFNYATNGNFNGYHASFCLYNNFYSASRRFFTVNNIKHFTKNGVISINQGFSTANKNLKFGNLNINKKNIEQYLSANYKWFINSKLTLQTGASYNSHKNISKDSLPIFYYALEPKYPAFYSKHNIHNNIVETYAYASWKINSNFSVSSGLRKNIPDKEQKNYLNSQLGISFTPNNKHTFLLSGGKYHSYNVPSYYLSKFSLLSSTQLAFDYTFTKKNTIVKSAIYAKKEDGEQSTDNFFIAKQNKTIGCELYFKQTFLKRFIFSFSDAYIHQRLVINDRSYKGKYNFNYLIKSSLQYQTPHYLTITASFILNPGLPYNEILKGEFNTKSNSYEPIYSNNLYGAKHNNYKKLDIGISKYYPTDKGSLIFFVSVNNILNTKNERSAYYNSNYSKKEFLYYQYRTIYFGIMWQLY